MGIFRQLFFCLLLLISGCSRDLFLDTRSNVLENCYGNPILWKEYPVLVTIDSSLSLEEKNNIINSINRWNLIAEDEIFIYQFGTNSIGNGVWITNCNLEIAEDGTRILGRINRFFDLDLSGQPIAIKFANICILENLNSDYRDVVIFHELGHALSLNHDLNLNSIMYLYAIHEEQTIEEQDVLFIRSLINL